MQCVNYIKSGLHHKRKYFNIVRLCISNIHLHSTAGLAHKAEGYRNKKQIHSLKVDVDVITVKRLIHILGIIDRTVVCLKNILAYFLKARKLVIIEHPAKIIGMTAKIYPRLAVWICVSISFNLKFCHNMPPDEFFILYHAEGLVVNKISF